jgi:hypothetical protein
VRGGRREAGGGRREAGGEKREEGGRRKEGGGRREEGEEGPYLFLRDSKAWSRLSTNFFMAIE